MSEQKLRKAIHNYSIGAAIPLKTQVQVFMLLEAFMIEHKALALACPEDDSVKRTQELIDEFGEDR